jgi:hypothetical protein
MKQNNPTMSQKSAFWSALASASAGAKEASNSTEFLSTTIELPLPGNLEIWQANFFQPN